MPKVSVIIPVYNVEKYLRQALDSVINQTLKDIEIICIDDCSPDNSYEILKEYAAKEHRIVLLKQETNQGPGIARNRGLDIAKGEYIMFLDPDDWLELDACEIAYNTIAANNTDIAIFPHNRYYEDSNETKFIDKMITPFKKQKNKGKIQLEELNTAYIVACLVVFQIYNREFLNKNNIRYSDNRIYEDHLMYIHAIICAENISIIDEPLYTYRIRKTSSTFVCNNKPAELYRAKKQIYKKVKQYSISYNKRQAINTHTIKSALYWYNKNENKELEKEFYNYVHKIFNMIDKEYRQKEAFKRLRIDKYLQYKQMLDYNYTQYRIIKYLESKNILKIKYIQKYKRKQIDFMGIKFKYKNMDCQTT